MAQNIVMPAELRALVDQVEADAKTLAGPSADEQIRAAITATLGQLGALTVQDDSLVFEGTKFVLPTQYEGRAEAAVKFLESYIQQQGQRFQYGRTFNYRPFDGAHAFAQVLRELSGVGGLGATKWSFFGPILPSFQSVKISHNKSTQVPWGDVAYPPLEAKFDVSYTEDKELGILFRLNATAPKKYRKHVEAIFQLVEDKLKVASIYRGQAITGQVWPEFLNVNLVDPRKVVYSAEVQTQLGANLWSMLEYTDQHRELEIPLKRAVLISGPFGTGKTLAGMLTAQKAIKNGWTFIQCRTGVDDPAMVLRTAQLYAPAVVWIEDIDLVASGGSRADIARLLDMLDGVTNKGTEVVAGFTTNYLGEIQKGALRPGRIDAIIELGKLDEAGFKRLVEMHVPAKHRAKDIDYHAVAVAFDGFLPAFAVEAINRAMRYSLHRNHGALTTVATDDLVHAANGLRPQLDLMTGAKEGADKTSIDGHLTHLVEGVLKRTSVHEAEFEVKPATVMNGAASS
jgi:transitional endoplasmic reticulum ATPase